MDKSKTSAASLGLSPADWLLPLRLITGWTYFSAFWRRLILENKLDPEAAGYIGVKFNHFLPNAFAIKPAIEFFVSHPELLWWKLLAFTLVEAVVGLALMLGLLTRAAGIATSLLALGILLGAGWLGTTCLDEWQIGILGIAAGIAFAFAGGGRYSVDHALTARFPLLKNHRIWRWLSLEPLALPRRGGLFLAVAVAAFGLALLTNQVFHGGLWGPLHNKSVRPKVELTETHVLPEGIRFTAMRVEGADVYGSFVVAARLRQEDGSVLREWTSEQLARLPKDDIANDYVAHVRTGPHGLILPLGAKADILLRTPGMDTYGDDSNWQLELEDVSGAVWSGPVLSPKQP